MIFLFLITLAQSSTLFIFQESNLLQEIIIEQSGFRQELMPSLKGYYPYGSNLTGTLVYIEELCQFNNQIEMDSIVLTMFSSGCSAESQLSNVARAKALIFIANETFINMSAHTQTLPIFGIVQNKAMELQRLGNQKAIILLQVPKTILPVMKYVIYTLDQNTEVLQQVQYFRQQNMQFAFEPIYYYFKRTVRESGNFTQVQLLIEYIKSHCIFQITQIETWIDYGIRYQNQCLEFEETVEILECTRLLSLQYINHSKILECAISENGLSDSIHQFIQDQTDLTQDLPDLMYKEYGLVWINGYFIGGNYLIVQDSWDTDYNSSIFRALCDSYLQDIPDICQSKITSVGVGNHDKSVLIIIFIVFPILLMTLIGYIFYRRRSNLILNINQQLMNPPIDE